MIEIDKEISKEEKDEITIKVRWRDCFKFWIAGFLFQFALTIIVWLVILTTILKTSLGGI